jgi:hypothetical protein
MGTGLHFDEKYEHVVLSEDKFTIEMEYSIIL